MIGAALALLVAGVFLRRAMAPELTESVEVVFEPQLTRREL